jgi:hypothetical protein
MMQEIKNSRRAEFYYCYAIMFPETIQGTKADWVCYNSSAAPDTYCFACVDVGGGFIKNPYEHVGSKIIKYNISEVS